MRIENEAARGKEDMRRYREIPAIVLTGQDEEEDMPGAFTAGADDYVVKPFPMRVLVKRIQAVLFRCGERKEAFLYQGPGIEFACRRVTRNGEEIPLTIKEYRLLEFGQGDVFGE